MPAQTVGMELHRMRGEHFLRILVVDRSPILANAVASHLITGLKPRDVVIDVLIAEEIQPPNESAWDIVIMDPSCVSDVDMTVNGFLGISPDIKLIAYASSPTGELVHHCLAIGFKSFISKSTDEATLLRVVRVTMSGGSFVDRASGRNSLFKLPERTEGQLLTEREEDILRMTAQGYSASSIARKFGVSVKTVDTHRARAMKKLGLKGRPALIRMASAKDWLS